MTTVAAAAEDPKKAAEQAKKEEKRKQAAARKLAAEQMSKLFGSVPGMSQDILDAMRLVDRQEIRLLVDGYYTFQKMRVETSNRLSAVSRNTDKAPCRVLSWELVQLGNMENQLKAALQAYVETKIEGQWMLSVFGIGPVLAAGILAYVDMAVAKTPGHIYSFAGLDPSKIWLGAKKTEEFLDSLGISHESTKVLDDKTVTDALEAASKITGVKFESYVRQVHKDKGGEPKDKVSGKDLYRVISRRPWNSKFKTLCWKIGETFRMRQNKPHFYCVLWKQRKTEEDRRNAAGELAEYAALCLTKKKIRKSTNAYKAYKAGKLPAAHITNRVNRWVAKLFLSHFWEVAYEVHYGCKPPFNPYIINHPEKGKEGQHVHKIEVPRNDKGTAEVEDFDAYIPDPEDIEDDDEE